MRPATIREDQCNLSLAEPVLARLRRVDGRDELV